MCYSNCDCGGFGCRVSWIAKILLIVGGLNWGLVGLGMLMNSDWNVVYMLLRTMPTLEAIVYLLVGVSAVLSIFGCRCSTCAAGGCGACGLPGNSRGSSM